MKENLLLIYFSGKTSKWPLWGEMMILSSSFIEEENVWEIALRDYGLACGGALGFSVVGSYSCCPPGSALWLEKTGGRQPGAIWEGVHSWEGVHLLSWWFTKFILIWLSFLRQSYVLPGYQVFKFTTSISINPAILHMSLKVNQKLLFQRTGLCNAHSCPVLQPRFPLLLRIIYLA